MDSSPSCGMNWPVEIKNTTAYLGVRFITCATLPSWLTQFYSAQMLFALFMQNLTQAHGLNAVVSYILN